MSAVQHIALRIIPLGLAIMVLFAACTTAGIIKAEEEALAAASRFLSERGTSPEGDVTVEGGLFRGYACHAVVEGKRVAAKAPTPGKACALMAYVPSP